MASARTGGGHRGEYDMSKTKRMLVALTLAVALGTLTAGPAFADPPKPPCQPGQQGNPDPAFKPGSCK